MRPNGGQRSVESILDRLRSIARLKQLECKVAFVQTSRLFSWCGGSARASLPDEIRAWARFSDGNIQGAITLLRAVADRQAKIGEGEVELPAREMLPKCSCSAASTQTC